MSVAKRGFWRSGDPFVWAAGGAVAISLLMVFGLVLLVSVKGLGFFWPADVAKVALADGTTYVGEIVGRERIPAPGDSGEEPRRRIQLKVGNRDVYGLDFRWVDEEDIESISYPKVALVLERWEWGNLYGEAVRLEDGGEVLAAGEGLWPSFERLHLRMTELRRQIRELERGAVGAINHRIATATGAIREIQLAGGPRTESERTKIERARQMIAAAEAEYQELLGRIHGIRSELQGPVLVVALADGSERPVAVADIVSAYRPNAMGTLAKAGHYLANVWAFVIGEPRESNTEGGILPAIFGTVLMVLIMTVAVVPVGVLAAVYLKEYAGNGWIVSLLRIAIRNLAGVPSIVFGVFGLGFFIYCVGGGIDRFFFPERLPTPTFGTGGILWASLTLGLLTLPVVIVATEEGLSAVPDSMREASYALGSTQFETVWRVAVPSAMPGILTGVILGIARATGEVAPLMMTGVVKLASELPIDGFWPFLHLERKFMHLGFFIYDLGFQSPNVEAARPMVYATTLALLAVVFLLNIIGIALRNRLRRRDSSV